MTLRSKLLVSVAAVSVAVVLAFGSDSDNSDDMAELEAAQELNKRAIEELRTGQDATKDEAKDVVDAGSEAAVEVPPMKRPPTKKAVAEVDPTPTAASGSGKANIVSHRGTSLVVTMQGTPPAKGSSVQLSKRIKQKLFGANVEADLNIGMAKVSSISGDRVTLDITEEQSTIVVDGKKTDHFKSGTELDLKW